MAVRSRDVVSVQVFFLSLETVIKRLFNPPPQFSRLGILVSLRPIFLCNFQFLVCDVHVCVPLFVWVGITFLPLYSLASVLCTCISMEQINVAATFINADSTCV